MDFTGFHITINGRPVYPISFLAEVEEMDGVLVPKRLAMLFDGTIPQEGQNGEPAEIIWEDRHPMGGFTRHKATCMPENVKQVIHQDKMVSESVWTISKWQCELSNSVGPTN